MRIPDPLRCAFPERGGFAAEKIEVFAGEKR